MDHLTAVVSQHIMNSGGAYNLWAERARVMYQGIDPWWEITRREATITGLAGELRECYAERNKPFPLSSYRGIATYTFDVPGALYLYWSLMDAALGAVSWRAIAEAFVYDFNPVDPIKRSLAVSEIIRIVHPYRRHSLAGWYKAVELQLVMLLKEIATLPYTIGAASSATMVTRTIPWAVDKKEYPEEDPLHLAWLDLKMVLNGTIKPEWT